MDLRNHREGTVLHLHGKRYRVFINDRAGSKELIEIDEQNRPVTYIYDDVAREAQRILIKLVSEGHIEFPETPDRLNIFNVIQNQIEWDHIMNGTKSENDNVPYQYPE